MKTKEYVDKYKQLCEVLKAEVAFDKIVTEFANEGLKIIKDRNCRSDSARSAVLTETVDKFRRFAELTGVPFDKTKAKIGFARLLRCRY